MSNQITTAFVQQFSANITTLSQQQGSILRGAVRQESVTGEKAFFDQVGSTAAVKRTSRHGDTPLVETPHSRRMVTMDSYEWSDLIDDADKVAMLADPTNVYAQSASFAIGRAMDDAIIEAATGTAKTGKSGGTSTTLPSGQQIAAGSADLTIAKLIQTRKIFSQNSVDPSIPLNIVVGPEQIESLLNTTQVTSSDFNTVRALVSGQVDTFMGMTFHISNRLAKSGNNRTCFAFASDGITMAVGKDVMARIDERADKSYSTQVYYCATFGATRMEEEKVVQILCDESA